jgi:hypothetical protein
LERYAQLGKYRENGFLIILRGEELATEVPDSVQSSHLLALC